MRTSAYDYERKEEGKNGDGSWLVGWASVIDAMLPIQHKAGQCKRGFLN